MLELCKCVNNLRLHAAHLLICSRPACIIYLVAKIVNLVSVGALNRYDSRTFQSLLLISVANILPLDVL